MADVFTGATSAAGSGQLTNQVLTAYQRSAFNALRAEVHFDQFAKVKPGDLTSPGNPVKFLFWDDMSPVTTAIPETVDVDAVGLSDSLVTVTPEEYANAVLLTIRIRTDDFLIGFDEDVAELLNWNMIESIDGLVQAVVDAGGTEETVAASEGATVASNELTAALVRKQRAKLKGASVRPWMGGSYGSLIHPDVALDLKSETGEAAWAVPSAYSDASRIWNDEIGKFAGIRFVESERCTINANGGSGAVDTYTSYFFGREFLAKAESIPPNMILSPVTDRLRRFQPLAWHFYAGWSILRSAALRRVVSASSIGDNT